MHFHLGLISIHALIFSQLDTVLSTIASIILPDAIRILAAIQASNVNGLANCLANTSIRMKLYEGTSGN